MPVLINKETGLAEDLPDEQAHLAVTQGTHALPLNDPNGAPVIAEYNDAPGLMRKGYSQPTPEQLKGALDYTKYSSPTEQAKTFLEGAAQAATFGGSTAFERASGVAPEAIQARRQINPGVSQAGQVAGLVGSSFLAPELSAAKALGAAGEAGAAALGLAGEGGFIAKVGSQAAKAAVETAIYQSGDEASKLFSGDPNQSAESVVTDIGLSGLIGGATGGALGAVSPLWEAAKGSQLGGVLGLIKSRINGETAAGIPAATDAAIEQSGISITPAMRATLSENPQLSKYARDLVASETGAGMKMKAEITNFKKAAGDAIISSFGKSPEDVGHLSELSDYDMGSKAKNSLISEIKSVTDPLAEQFSRIKEKFKGAAISEEERLGLSEQLAQIGQKYAVSPSSAEFQKINKIIEELPNVKTLEDLRNFQSAHLGDIANKHLWGINAPVRTALRDVEEGAVMRELGVEAPDLVAEHQAARASYRTAMQDIDALNDRLHVGRYSGPDSFIHALKEMKPEDVLRRLSSKADVDLLNHLSEKLPQTAELVRDYHLDSAFKKAADTAPSGESININSFFKSVDKMSPELRQFVMGPYANGEKAQAIQKLVEALPAIKNPSGTAITKDTMESLIPGSAGAAISYLMGHGAASGFLLGHLTRLAARDAPDAIKLGLLKFIGSDQPVNASAFKAMVDFAASAQKSYSLIQGATKAVFKAGTEVLPQSYLPTPKTRQKLDKRIQDLSADSSSLLNTGGESGYYLPEHATVLGSTAARAVQYLSAMRPKEGRQSPLDKPMVPSAMAVARYERALDISEQPLLVLSHIQKGSLVPEDVMTMKNLYPSLYAGISEKIQHQMVDHISKGKDVPYLVRMSLSLFLGQNLDSTLSPAAILATQPVSPQAQMQQGVKPQSRKSSMKGLTHLGTMDMTPSQARQAEKMKAQV